MDDGHGSANAQPTSSHSKVNTADSLQSGYLSLSIDNESQNSNTNNERIDVQNSDTDPTSVVQSWSTEQVRNWFQKNVPFEKNRMEDYLQIFQKENVDGLSFTTLKRSHRACFGMMTLNSCCLRRQERGYLMAMKELRGFQTILGHHPPLLTLKTSYLRHQGLKVHCGREIINQHLH